MRRLAVIAGYTMGVALLLAVPLMMIAMPEDRGDRAFAIILYGAIALALLGLAAGMLWISVALRPIPSSAPVAAPPGVFVLFEWGVPRAVTGAVSACIFIPGIGLLVAAMLRIEAQQSLPGWIRVALLLVVLAAGIIVLSLATDHVVLALRRRLQRRYPHRPLLVAGEAGIALRCMAPLEWAAVSDIRLTEFTLGNNRIPMLAVDTVVPPAADDPRSGRAHRYLHGGSFVVDLRAGVVSPAEALAAIVRIREGATRPTSDYPG